MHRNHSYRIFLDSRDSRVPSSGQVGVQTGKKETTAQVSPREPGHILPYLLGR